MFCEYCGKKIDEDSNFCEHCGKKILTKKKLSKEKKTGLIIILFLVFFYIFFLELKYFNSPENAINSYLKNRNNNDYENVLKNLNIESGPFTSKEAYLNVTKSTMDSFTIHSCEYDETKQNAVCHVTIETKNDTSQKETFYLEKKEKKRLGIFTDWIIKTNDIKTTKDWHIYLPKDFKAKLANIDLDSYQSNEETKNGYDCYIIPEIFMGDYQLELTLPNEEIIKKEIQVSTNSYTYELKKEDISEEQKSELEQLGTHIIELFYNSSVTKKPFAELETTYNIKKLEETYNKLVHEIEKTDLISFKVNEIAITGIEMTENCNIKITYQMNYNYHLKYETNETKEEHQGTSNDTFYITTQTMEWNDIEKMESLVTYFSKKY